MEPHGAIALYIAAALAGAAPVSANGVATEPIGPAEYRITVTLEGEVDPAAAAGPVMTAAKKVCGDLNIVYGKYRFESSEPVSDKQTATQKQLVFRQDILCTNQMEEPRTEAPEQLTPERLASAELDALEPNISDLSNRFFSARDKGDDPLSYSFVDREAMGRSFENWSDESARNRKELGAPAIRRILQITWYQNPPTAPQSGLYAAVDFTAEYEEQNECGYLIWARPSSRATFLITRMDVTRIPRDLDAESQTAMRAKFCPGG